jgi:ribonuclease BN (tRNA processing enzyme)
LADIIILGSGTGIPSLQRGSPGLLLLSDDATVLIDSGSGVLGKMLQAGVTYRDVDLLLYTHIHPDHIADLIPLLFACKYAEVPREKDLFCIGGPGFENYFAQLKKIYGRWVEPRSYRLTLAEISLKALPFRDLTIFATPLAHMPESVGYRIELNNGRTIAVSGDTDYCRAAVDLASGVDLLVLECSFPEGKKVEGHLTPSLAGRIAAEAHCRRLLLTHLYPPCDRVDMAEQCREVFDGQIILAEDFMRISV